MNLLKSLFGSKKFVAMLSGLVGLLILKLFKVSVDPATVAEIVGLIASYLIGQGIADNGKAAAQVSAISNVQTLQATSAAEKIDAIKSV